VSAARKAHLESFADHEKQIPSDADLIRDDFTANQPTEIEIGSRRGQPIKIPLGGMSVGLTGPGAVEAARAIATEVLTGAHHNRVELVIPHHDANALFTRSTDDLARLSEAVEGLVMPSTEEAAVAHLEAEVIHRARMMERHNQPDVPALRATDPAEPLPAIMLIAAASDRWAATLDAVLGPRYCVGALLLGPWPHGTTCHVEADGTISRADGPAADTWMDVQLFHLSSAEAAEMLSVIRTARSSDEQTLPTSGQPSDSKQTTQPGPAPPLPEPPERKTTAQRLVQIHVLGPARVEAGGEPIGTGLRRISKALLTYLALNPHGVTREQGVEALWPGRDPAGGATMFHTAINNVRKTLRKTSGRREPMFITYINGRYQLDPQLIDVDLWHVLDALAAASNTEDPTQKITALRRVADLYTAELAEDATYEWAELERERFRRSATDALVALARLVQAEHPDQALTALEQAISHDVYSEPLYRSIMRLQARLGRPDAVRRTYRLLEDHFADLDVDPSSETAQLLSELLQPKAQQERL
jgi:DNA-binding SARP family transcriptional activator